MYNRDPGQSLNQYSVLFGCLKIITNNYQKLHEDLGESLGFSIILKNHQLPKFSTNFCNYKIDPTGQMPKVGDFQLLQNKQKLSTGLGYLDLYEPN